MLNSTPQDVISFVIRFTIKSNKSTFIAISLSVLIIQYSFTHIYALVKVILVITRTNHCVMLKTMLFRLLFDLNIIYLYDYTKQKIVSFLFF